MTIPLLTLAAWLCTLALATAGIVAVERIRRYGKPEPIVRWASLVPLTARDLKARAKLYKRFGWKDHGR